MLLIALLACVPVDDTGADTVADTDCDADVDTDAAETIADPPSIPVVARWYASPTLLVCDLPWWPFTSEIAKRYVARWVTEAGPAYVVGVEYGGYMTGDDSACTGPIGDDVIRIRASGERDLELVAVAGPHPIDPDRLVSVDVVIDGEETPRELLHVLGHAFGWGDVAVDDAPDSIMVHDGDGEDFAGLDPYWVLP